MNMNFSAFQAAFVLFLAVAGLIATVFYVFLISFRFKKKIFGSLNFILYELSFINEDLLKEGQAEKNTKELISKMEQFLSGVVSLKGKKNGFFNTKNPYFALELAARATGDEVVFYAAVPKDESRLFEKQFESLFPYGDLKLKKDDYNIFNSEGFSAFSF